jgi:hypothetical protein
MLNESERFRVTTHGLILYCKLPSGGVDCIEPKSWTFRGKLYNLTNHMFSHPSLLPEYSDPRKTKKFNQYFAFLVFSNQLKSPSYIHLPERTHEQIFEHTHKQTHRYK